MVVGVVYAPVLGELFAATARRRGDARRRSRSAAATAPTSGWPSSAPGSATPPTAAGAQAAIVADLIGVGPRHPPPRLGGARPVLRRRRALRRLLRDRPQQLGRRRRRADRPRGRLPQRRPPRRPAAARPSCSWRPRRSSTTCSACWHVGRSHRSARCGSGARRASDPHAALDRPCEPERSGDRASWEPWEPESWPSRTTSASARRSSWRSRTRAGPSRGPDRARRPSSCSASTCPTSC